MSEAVLNCQDCIASSGFMVTLCESVCLGGFEAMECYESKKGVDGYKDAQHTRGTQYLSGIVCPNQASFIKQQQTA